MHSAKEKFASFYRYILCLINQMIEFTPWPPLVFLLFFQIGEMHSAKEKFVSCYRVRVNLVIATYGVYSIR